MNSFLVPIILTVIGTLIGAFITIRYTEVSRKRDRFEGEFDEFRVVITDFTSRLRDKETSLNKIILEDFNKQDRAINKFIHNLNGKRRTRFEKEWNLYCRFYEHAE